MAGAFHIVHGSLRPSAVHRSSFAPAPLPNCLRLPSSVNSFVERGAQRKSAGCKRRPHNLALVSAVAATEERVQEYVTACALSQVSMYRSRSMGTLRMQEASYDDV